MKKNFLILWMLLFSLNAFPQSIPMLWPDGDRILNAEKDSVKVFDENGILRMKIWYDSSTRDSIIIGYKPGGQPEFRFEGKRRTPLNGCIRMYFSEGVLKEKLCWENDRPAGSFISYHKNGKIAESGFYEDGEKSGRWLSRHPNGVMKSMGNYNSGIKDGTWIFLHNDSMEAYREEWNEGILLMISDFTDNKGRRHSGGNAKSGFGEIRRYFENGKRKQVFSLMNGEAEGIFTEYDSLGRILRIKEFRKGVLNGKLIEFYPDSTVASVVNYENGFENGPYTAFDPGGKSLSKASTAWEKKTLPGPNGMKQED